MQTGEEAEKALVDMKCKLYRFDPESSEWKERGVGQVKCHREGRVRVYVRVHDCCCCTASGRSLRRAC